MIVVATVTVMATVTVIGIVRVIVVVIVPSVDGITNDILSSSSTTYLPRLFLIYLKLSNLDYKSYINRISLRRNSLYKQAKSIRSSIRIYYTYPIT